MPGPIEQDKSSATKPDGDDTMVDANQDEIALISSTPSASGLHVHLHPLVILNISDHHTRGSIQFGLNTVVGALVGVQNGRDIQVCNSFELRVEQDTSNGKWALDKAFFISKSDQYKQVFKTMDVVGWYSTGSSLTSHDIDIHKQILELNESPLFLKLDPRKMGATAQELPIGLYESIIEIKDGSSKMAFAKLGYSIETEEAERLAVSHVASATNADAAKGSTFISHLVSQKNAIEMLQSRILFVLKYLQDVEKRVVQKDDTLHRQIASLCHRLPTMEGQEFHNEMISEYNNVMLIQYLSQMTQSAESLNELVEKQNSLNLHRGAPHGRSFRDFDGRGGEGPHFRTPRLDF